MTLKNTQNRPPPAYQEYAADLLSSRHFKRMSLEERGLYLTMKLECWVNGSCTANLSDLALDLNLDIQQLTNCLTELVKSFFMVFPDKFVMKELEDYRLYLATRRAQQSEGGKRGAEKRKRNAQDNNP